MIKIILTIIFLIPFWLLGLPLVLLALPFAKNQHLPKWAWLWDNHEAVYGMDGGYAWERKLGEKRKKWWWRWVWLTWRNPIHNLVLYKIGIPTKFTTYWYKGDDWNFVEKYGGYHYGITYLRGKEYPQIFYHNKFIYIRIGWKHGYNTEYNRFSCIFIRSKLK